MPQNLTLAEIEQYQTQIKQGGINAVLQVYDSLYESGYNYAGWAGGVARGDSISGQAALQFMQSSAAMGLSGEAGQNLNPLQLDALRVDMALGYLQALGRAAQGQGGSVNQDLDFEATKNFHGQAFEKYGLSLANWTLTTPMDLIERTEGPQAVEDLWARIRETGGDGPDGLVINMILAQRMGALAFNPDPTISGPAQQWMDQTPGVANLAQWGRTLDVAWDALIEATAVTIVDGDIQTRYYANGVKVETSTHVYDAIEYGAIKVGSDWVPYSVQITSPSGVVQYIGKSGTATSINGQVTRYEATETNGDQTIREFDHNGNMSKLIEVDGAHDNANYATRSMTYDAQGRTFMTETMMDDGTRSEDYYYLDFNPWLPLGSSSTHYDAQGRNDASTFRMNDGSAYSYRYDVDGSQPWSSTYSLHDAQGQIYRTEVTMDDGTRGLYVYGVYGDGSVTYTHYDAQMRSDLEEVTMSDGSREVLRYDPTNTSNWSFIKEHYDTQGRNDSGQIRMKDGSRTDTLVDASNSQSWAAIQSHYDAQGRNDATNVWMDDGTLGVIENDVNNSQSWSSIVNQYDAQGRIELSSVRRDDGGRRDTFFDSDGSQDWSSTITDYDASGRKATSTQYLDNGERIERTYFPDQHPDAFSESHFYADGRGAGGTILFDGYSSKLFIGGNDMAGEFVGGVPDEWLIELGVTYTFHEPDAQVIVGPMEPAL